MSEKSACLESSERLALAREARERAENDSLRPASLSGYMSYRPKSDIYALCDALEEANERIRELEELLVTYRITSETREGERENE